MAQTATLDFHVWGPSKVQIDLTGGTDSFIDLGYTDNSDLISFELDIMTEPIMTTRMGNIPEDYIHLGTIGYLSMTLVKWSENYTEDLFHGSVPDGAVEGDVGTVGKLRMGVQGTTDQTFGTNFSLRVLQTGTDSPDSIDFHNCIIEGRGIRMLDFGNRPQRLGLSIVCLPYSAGGDGVHTGTDNIYTRNYA